MGRKKPAGNKQAGVVPGTWEISTGEMELVADDMRDDAWIVKVNGVYSSHISPNEPLLLDFEYMRWIAAVVEDIVDTRLDADKLRITHLGGAACTLPRYFSHRYPGSRNTVVELDAQLAHLVREFFALPRAPRVKIRVGDARTETDGFVPDSRDIIIRDVFGGAGGATTPENLTTVEFFDACAQSLTSAGLYLANCGDHSDLSVARAELAGMAEVFAHLAVVGDPAMLKGRRYGNLILVGSNAPLPADGALARTLLGGGVPAQYHAGAWVKRFRSGGTARHDPRTGA